MSETSRRRPWRGIASFTAAAITVGLLTSTAGAEPASPVEDLGEPLRDVLLIGGDVGPGPHGDTVLWSASSSTPAALNAVDPDTGELVATYPLPGSGGAWAVEVSVDGSVYVGSYGSSHLYRWTAATGVIDLGNPLPSGTFVWSLDSDENGVVYGGMSPNGAVFSYDPATGRFRDYGRVSSSDYVRSVAYEDGTVYLGTSRPSRVFALDPVTGSTAELPAPPAADPASEYVYDLNVWDGHLYARYGEASPDDLFVYDVAAGEWVDHIPAAHGLDVSAPGPDGTVYLVADGRLHGYDPTTRTLTPTDMPFGGRVANTRGIGWAELDDPDFPGRSIVGLLWRGSMFRYSPVTGAFDFVDAQIPGTPIPVTVLAQGAGDRVHAGGFLSGGFATFDSVSGDQTSFRRFAQMEAMVTIGDRTYLGAYPDARLYEYDPTQLWNSSEYSPSSEPGLPENPRQIVNLKSEEQVRAGALTGAGRYVALGTEPGLDRYGGVFLLWDSATEEVVFQERGLVPDQSIVALTYRDGIVYGASSIYGGYTATQPRASEAVVFAWSVDDRELLWQTAPVPGAGTVSDLAFDGAGTLWGTAAGEVFALDVATREVSRGFDGAQGAQQLEFNPLDGRLYVDWGGEGLGWFDAARDERHVVVDRNAHALTVDADGRVWFSEGTHVYRFATAVHCDSTVTGGHEGRLTISNGTVCLADATVAGPVIVADDATLVATDATIDGPLRATGAGRVVVTGSTVSGTVSVRDTLGSVELRDNTFESRVSLTGNRGDVVVDGNGVGGPLACSDNRWTPSGTENEVTGPASGQCASLG